MSLINVGSRREVCWDEYLIDIVEGIRVKMHQPEYRGVVFRCDKGWEGCNCGYFTILREGLVYRLYYRGASSEFVDLDGAPYHHANYFCLAESRDGKHFERVNVNAVPFMGSTENNIILGESPENRLDNVFIFYDTNPDCPANERYKGLSGADGQKLMLYCSSDGVNFCESRIVVDDGAYDSLNICFWDPDTKQYWLFFRGLHGPHTDGNKWNFSNVPKEEMDEATRHGKGIVRDVRVRTSRDFIHWEPARMLDYGPDAPDLELYTNGILKYYRADHMFLGFPTRYIDRYKDLQNYKFLPDWKHRQSVMKHIGSRQGTAMTDAIVMTSRDGYHFRRTEEAFLTPGYERKFNWYYGDCYFAYGMIETTGDVPDAPNEISLYTHINDRCDDNDLCRYAIRLDGFFSWRCDAKPGKLLTKPFVFEGDGLSINFATSALGYIRIRLTDEDGTYLAGYDSGRMFGNSVDRPVDFDMELGALSGKPVRMELEMSDADLYSFKFSKAVRF